MVILNAKCRGFTWIEERWLILFSLAPVEDPYPRCFTPEEYENFLLFSLDISSRWRLDPNKPNAGNCCPFCLVLLPSDLYFVATSQLLLFIRNSRLCGVRSGRRNSSSGYCIFHFIVTFLEIKCLHLLKLQWRRCFFWNHSRWHRIFISEFWWLCAFFGIWPPWWEYLLCHFCG